ncbi:ABC transporter ATP-binding protein [Nakamurella deserti]|uniref:ABC transporter ATP-binding protein n=1 Tax=Nakamurella deserti TaxID=2164074 RepID=UPI000DBE0859|nr:ABC transporter ATP-binding protein [Nakamurella deserti]
MGGAHRAPETTDDPADDTAPDDTADDTPHTADTAHATVPAGADPAGRHTGPGARPGTVGPAGDPTAPDARTASGESEETGDPAAPAGAADETRIDDLRASLRLLGRHIRPLRLSMSIGLLLLVLGSLVGLGQPLATRYVLDSIGAGSALGGAVVLLVAFVLAAAVTQGLGQFLMLRSAEAVVLSSRRRLVDQLLGLSVTGMRRRDPGDLMARVTSDTALIRQIALQSLAQAVSGAVVVVGAIVVMLVLDPLLFTVTAAVVGTVGIVLGVLMPRIRRSSRQTQRAVGEMGNELERVLGAYTTVKAAGAERMESERLGRRVQKAHDSGVRTAWWNSLAAMTSVLAVQAAFLVVLGVGGWRVQSGAMSVTTLIAFLLYAMQLSAPVLQMTQAISAFQSGRAALERIAELDAAEREADPAVAASVDDVARVPGAVADLGAVSWSPAVELRGVSFTYPGERTPAIRNASFTVPERGLTAIVGPSGSGKSSVLRLIDGFYPFTSGEFLVGGRPLAEWDLAALRAQVAYVEQETPLLAGTLRDNLTYGADDVDRSTLEAVLRSTGLAHLADADLDEQVGHRGSGLSGGERQRIAIARALLRDPRVLLLDESTSQLDATNEALIRRTVGEVAAARAVVLVAHRLATVVDADQIVVMADGRVEAVGTHDELMAAGGLYRTLVDQQRGTLAQA